jgi:hypothetical protein
MIPKLVKLWDLFLSWRRSHRISVPHPPITFEELAYWIASISKILYEERSKKQS